MTVAELKRVLETYDQEAIIELAIEHVVKDSDQVIEAIAGELNVIYPSKKSVSAVVLVSFNEWASANIR